MDDKAAAAQLSNLLEWAREKIHGDDQPPWAWFQYMKLQEVTESILKGMGASTAVDLPSLGERQGTYLRLAADSSRPENALRRPERIETPLPM